MYLPPRSVCATINFHKDPGNLMSLATEVEECVSIKKMLIQATQLYGILETLATYSNTDKKLKFPTQTSRNTNSLCLYHTEYQEVHIVLQTWWQKSKTLKETFSPWQDMILPYLGDFSICLMWPRCLQSKTMQENKLAQKHKMRDGEGTLVSSSKYFTEPNFSYFVSFSTFLISFFFFFHSTSQIKKKKTKQKNSPKKNKPSLKIRMKKNISYCRLWNHHCIPFQQHQNHMRKFANTI